MMLFKRTFILLEVLGFVLLALGSKALFSLIAWKYAGPFSLAVTLLALTFYMRKQGLTWAEFGFFPLKGIKQKLKVIPQTLLVLLGFIIAVGSILGSAELFQIAFLLEEPKGLELRFGEVKQDLTRFLMWLGIVWTSAAFGEEMFFRGYLITRMQTVFSSSVLAPIIAIVFAAAIFGFGHMDYQGWRGFVLTGAIGIAFGVLFLVFKKNLWPLILFHGLIDTASFTKLYLGLE